VFSVANGKVTTRTITILAESGTTAAVAGIEDGTLVVLNPPPGLLPGSSVQVVDLTAVPAGRTP
jgi:hypothetical protein